MGKLITLAKLAREQAAIVKSLKRCEVLSDETITELGLREFSVGTLQFLQMLRWKFRLRQRKTAVRRQKMRRSR